MRIWNPTQVDIADRPARLVGRVHVSDPTTPANMAVVTLLDANPASLSLQGLMAGAVPIATQGAGGVRVPAAGDGAPVRHLGVAAPLETGAYGTRSFCARASMNAPVIGNNPAIKLENPAASGRVLLVERLDFSVNAANEVTVNVGAVHEGGDANVALTAANNRQVGNAQAPVALLHCIGNSALALPAFTGVEAMAVGIPHTWTVTLRIPEGSGVAVRIAGAAAITNRVNAAFAWREE